MIKDFKIGDLVKVYGSDKGKVGLINNTVTNIHTGTTTYQVLFTNGEYEFLGVLWLSTYEE